jgi:hypothetical protein
MFASGSMTRNKTGPTRACRLKQWWTRIGCLAGCFPPTRSIGGADYAPFNASLFGTQQVRLFRREDN